MNFTKDYYMGLLDSCANYGVALHPARARLLYHGAGLPLPEHLIPHVNVSGIHRQVDKSNICQRHIEHNLERVLFPTRK